MAYTMPGISCESVPPRTVLSDDLEGVNVLHISDLHFGIGECEERDIFRARRRRLIENLVKQLYWYSDNYGNWRPNIVVVSGDLTNRAEKREYEQFFEDFYNLLTDPDRGVEVKLNSGDASKKFVLDDDCIVLCPGNHDVMRSVYKESEKKNPEMSGAIYSRPAKPIDRGIIGAELNNIPDEYKRIKHQHFSKISHSKATPFRNYIEMCCKGDPNKLVQLCIPKKWPWVHFAVLNSAWDSRENDDEGRLRVGLLLYQKLLEEHREKRVTGSILCTVFHHPIDGIEDYAEKRMERRVYNWLAPSERHPVALKAPCFLNYVRDTSKCIMNGHVHEEHDMRYIGNGDRVAAWSVCGATLPDDRHVYHCRVIKFRRGKGMVHCCDCISTEDDPNNDWILSSKPVSPADETQFKLEVAQRNIGEQSSKASSPIDNFREWVGALLEQTTELPSELSTDIVVALRERAVALKELAQMILVAAINDNAIEKDMLDAEKQNLEHSQEETKRLIRRKSEA